MTIDIRQIPAEDTYTIRAPVLRPGLPVSESCFPNDHEPDALHLGTFVDGRLVGTASFFREDHPELPSGGYRLRGMAVQPSSQGTGLGGALLEEGLRRLEEADIPHVWCNARKTAVDFYCHRGFRIIGDEFEIPHIGPHFLMIRG